MVLWMWGGRGEVFKCQRIWADNIVFTAYISKKKKFLKRLHNHNYHISLSYSLSQTGDECDQFCPLHVTNAGPDNTKLSRHVKYALLPFSCPVWFTRPFSGCDNSRQKFRQYGISVSHAQLLLHMALLSPTRVNPSSHENVAKELASRLLELYDTRRPLDSGSKGQPGAADRNKHTAPYDDGN